MPTALYLLVNNNSLLVNDTFFGVYVADHPHSCRSIHASYPFLFLFLTLVIASILPCRIQLRDHKIHTNIFFHHLVHSSPSCFVNLEHIGTTLLQAVSSFFGLLILLVARFPYLLLLSYFIKLKTYCYAVSVDCIPIPNIQPRYLICI